MPETVTTDQAGVARTETGEIAPTPTPVQEASPASTTPAPTETPKPTETKPESSLANQPDAKAPEGAPNTYADFKVPEGFEMDPEVRTEASALFKGMNLSQDNAQKLVDFYTAKTREAFETPFNAYQDTRKEWRAAAESNPTLRGKLGPGGEVLTTINRAINGLNNPQLASAFREAMDFTGAGDNPAFIETFFLIAQQLTEGSHVAGRGPSPMGQGRPGTVRSPATDLWPNLPSAANQR